MSGPMVLLWGNTFMMMFSQSRNCVITQYVVIIIEEMSFVTQSLDCPDSIPVRERVNFSCWLLPQ